MFVRPIGFLALIAMLVPALVSAAPLPRSEPLIRVGITIGDAYAEGYYAQDLGFFKKAGLHVQLTQFSTGAAISTGVLSGTVDLGVATILQLARATLQGAPYVLLASAGMYSSRSPLVALAVARNSPLRTAADFEGKTIAIVSTSDVAYLGIMAWLDRNGGNSAKTYYIQIPWAEMPAALESGLADGALLAEPWLTAAVEQGTIRVIAHPYEAVAPQFIVGAWFTTKSWYRTHREAAKRFARAIYEAGRWANAHQDLSAALLAKHAKMDVETIRASARAPYASSLDVSLLQPLLDLAYRYHALGRRVDAAALIAR